MLDFFLGVIGWSGNGRCAWFVGWRAFGGMVFGGRFVQLLDFWGNN